MSDALRRVTSSRFGFEGSGNPALAPIMAVSGTFVMGSPVEEIPPEQRRSPSESFYGGGSTTAVANPMMIRPVEYAVQETAPSQLANELQNAFRDARVITPDQLDNYADELVKIAQNLATRAIDVMVVPYRGGLTPNLHLQVMTFFKYPSLSLGFTAGSQERNHTNIEEELVFKLETFTDRRALTIGITDTAIRGDGSLKLAHILKTAKRHFAHQSWRVFFHLLHSPEKYPTPPLAKEISNLSTGDLIFEVDFHRVSSLLVEDWDAAIGLKAEWENGTCYYKTTTLGQVIVKLPDKSVAVLESPNLPVLINSFIAESVTNSMLTDPRLHLKHANENPPQ
jgi:hypothetical protein